MPDYAVSFDGDNVRFVNRKSMKPLPSPDKTLFIHDSILKPTMTPGSWRLGYDVYDP